MPAGAGTSRIVVFGKYPVPGRVKTRLQPLLGAEGAARLYRAFLWDCIEVARRVDEASVEVWLEGPAAGPGDVEEPWTVPVRRQEGGSLGARLRHAFETSFQEGAGRTLVFGSDHPTLPPSHLSAALRALGRRDVVAGPSRDGGYYAIGIRRGAWPRAGSLFRAIPWSTPTVLELTRARARALGLRWAEVPAWYDVDVPRHLELLRGDLREGSRTAAALARLLPLANLPGAPELGTPERRGASTGALGTDEREEAV